MYTKTPACQRNRDLLLKMNEQGETIADMARAVGTNRRHVRAFLKREGKWRKFPVHWSGHEANHWKGGRMVNAQGYVLIYTPNHPFAIRKGKTLYMLEHRLVMEKHLGRYLQRNEVVHHKNKNHADNRIENLILFENNASHLKHELKGKRPNWTADGLAGMRKPRNRIVTKTLLRSLLESKPSAAQLRESLLRLKVSHRTIRQILLRMGPSLSPDHQGSSQ